MNFKMGFAVEPETEECPVHEEYVSDTQKQPQTVKKSVVDIFFPDRHLTCTYYNDRFNLKRGDMVYVDGKLEGLRGRVVDVNYTFKIKLSDYKRVIGVVDTNVVGEFHLAGSHFVTVDRRALPYEKARTWFMAPENEDDEYVSASGDESFYINDLSGLKVDSAVTDRGHEYYIQNRVAYIELDHRKGKAIVKGSKPYEVEFQYNNGEISGLVCGCYCSGTCKHEFAAILQLKETLDTIAEYYYFIDPDAYLAIVSKVAFFDFVGDNMTKGSFTMG